MPPKRLRRASPVAQGLSAGERLKRAKLSGNDYLAWSWVGSEVTSPTQITLQHRQATCGFADSNHYPFCSNKYAVTSKARNSPKVEESKGPKVEGELEDDVIVISDDESPSCTAKGCKSNPNCLNYLGQEKWENEDKARSAFMKVSKLDSDPSLDMRSLNTPIGLKNLGATCYANAYLQVWFQDLPFRAGVYSCQPSQEDQQKFEDSPVFQLQVTFAAMQLCKDLAFNPTKLVESLKLRTTEQQDAQEFSKLFMAHLDTEFQKQTDPTLQSLIADQFQGKQVYATVCAQCHNRSERESEFLEIEVNLANNAKLEDRIAVLLQPEELDGDNKYLCSKCDSLQNARRYTELRELPPVLHFSLLRFVYDLSTMERKKSKQAIAFPKVLDMDCFIKDPALKGDNTYQLRGVLLHKGQSAYHGHYEAQIFDVKSAAWYQFNDEVVTKIASLGPHPKVAGKTNGDASKQTKGKPKPKKSTSTKKQAAKADSDIEIIDDTTSSKSPPMVDDKNYILSRDAYMLVYVRTPKRKADLTERPNGHPLNGASHATSGLTPPLRALDVVNDLNSKQEELCKQHDMKKQEANARFEKIRRTVMDIYQTWSLSNNSEEDCVISRIALESWLSRHFTQKEERTPDSMDLDSTTTIIPNEDIQCEHGKIDPSKAALMKRVKKAAVDRIASEDGCSFVPSLGSSDVCEQCVEEQFIERLYQIEHPRLVTLFDEVCAVDEDEHAYWISIKWLKDWRSAKPRMHKPSQADPPPDDPEYDIQVRCEHGCLTPNALSRKRISSEAYELLRSVFPEWTTLDTDAEMCAACEALVHISKEDRRGAKIQAEEEKARLKNMCDNALNGGIQLLERVPCAIVPAYFVRTWKQWLMHPADVPRPDGVDNSEFICQHGRLVIDPNVQSDLDASAVIITRKDWETIEALYPGGPLIALENNGDEFVHDLPVCQECRLDRKTSFDVTELTVRLLRPEDPIPTPETYVKELPQRKPVQMTLTTYGSRTVGNLRQSKRLRQVGVFGKRKKVAVSRTTTIRDLKVKIQEQFDIPTIYQRLYYHGHELEENTATIGSLNVLANDVMDLREDSEDIDLLGSDTERSSRNPDEGQGFGGTLLLSSSTHLSSHSRTPSEHDEPMADVTRACPACTFENSPDVVCCAMCEGRL